MTIADHTMPEPVPGHPTPGMHIWGWTRPAELDWLAAQAAKMASVVEIGCLRGRSAYALLTACPGDVYCIDPWDDDDRNSLPAFVEACGHFKNLHALQWRSPAAAVLFDSVEMTFIDGDHDYEAVLADIDAWLPKTTVLICGHDWANADGGFEGVERACRDHFGSEIENPTGNIWAVWL